MKDIVIIGAGGFAREVAWLIENINKSKGQWNLLGFIDDDENLHGEKLNGYDILGDIDYLNKLKNEVYCVIAIGDGKTRKQIVDRINKNRKFATLIHPDVDLSSTNLIGEGCIICCGTILTVNKTRKQIVDRINKNRKFATLIHPDVDLSSTNLIGEGCIICCGTILTVNVALKNHIIINLDCTIGHDAILEDYTTLMPSVNVSGNVFIDKYTTVGTGTNIIQGLHIGKNSIVGAGSVVIRDIQDNCTVVGNPGRIIKK